MAHICTEDPPLPTPGQLGHVCWPGLLRATKGGSSWTLSGVHLCLNLAVPEEPIQEQVKMAQSSPPGQPQPVCVLAGSHTDGYDKGLKEAGR